MNLIPKILLLLGVLFATEMCFGQLVEDSLLHNRVTDMNPQKYKIGDSIWVRSGICKPLKVVLYIDSLSKNKFNPYKSAPLLKFHGNIQYDFIYRSLLDTPFSQKGFAQHTVQTTFDVAVKEAYPLKVTLLTRQTNSPFFNDMTDVSVQFNNGQFVQQVRNRLASQLPEKIGGTQLGVYEGLLRQKKWEAEALRNWLSHPMRVQEIIESRERQMVTRTQQEIAAGAEGRILNIAGSRDKKSAHYFLPKKVFEVIEKKVARRVDSLKAITDSLGRSTTISRDSSNQDETQRLQSQYLAKKRELDSLNREISSYEEKIKSAKGRMQDTLSQLKQELAQIKDPARLKEFIREHQLNDKNLPKGWHAFSAIKKIGIGRTWVDYSELTVKNISLSGLNMEVNLGKFYLALAAGKVNYRFRDFIIKNNNQSRQNLFLFRAGIGRSEGNNLIFTWYGGKRNMLNPAGNTAPYSSSLERVVGVSVQTRLQINSNSYLELESAKSSFHSTGTVNQPEEGLMKKVWNFKDHSNEAWSIKGASFWPATGTRLIGYYRKMGEHFQSFNLQPVNVSQEAYQVKLQQMIWRKRLTLEAGLRKNDFSNPFTNPGLSSKTVFKSFQATLRVPKYPFISIGYYPCSQLTVMNNNIIVENQYNTLSTVISHAYRVRGVSMSSSGVYLKFYNNGADTGFVYYNANSVTLNQFVVLKNIQVRAGFIGTSQKSLKVRTWEGSLSYRVRDWLTLSGGIKYNRVNNRETLWGASSGISVNIRGFGMVQGSYDKSYLPGMAGKLLPVDMGRLTYHRNF